MSRIRDRRVRWIGLTGGIATGKSVVARILAADFDAAVVDADDVVHALLAPGGAAFAAVVAAFGQDVLNADGRIDRKRLGRWVFQDAAARRRLEAIVHPLVIRETARLIETYLAAGAWLVVGVAPLMMEVGTHQRFPLVVVTHCSEATQIRRLRERGFSEAEARRRIEAQWPVEQKRRMADVVIDTEGSMAETRGQVLALVAWLWPAHPAIARFRLEGMA
ncbi:MAG: dephospho-CoA kinase [Acidobacteriota bacterium]|nr:dephospho-CoA kinase [Acidobacteriota bacterium]